MKNLPFEIHPKLAQDSIKIKDLELCELRLQKDGDVDWFILVPKRPNLVEIIDLQASDERLLYTEMRLVCETIKNVKKPFKLNVANLGNMVPQLHIHIIARQPNDRAWPHPIWGTPTIKPFLEAQVEFWQKHFV
jgi:diadenosine tetraphosphate (Ap4A) HIT family hydrolase